MDLKIFESMPGTSMLLQADAPVFTVLAFTSGFGPSMPTGAGKGIKDVLPSIYALDNWQPEKLEAVLKETATGQKEKEWHQDAGDTALHLHCKPVIDAIGQTAFLILSQHIAPAVQLQTEKGKLIEQAYTLMMNAPMAICIIKGDEQLIQLANKHILQIWRKGEDVVGKPLLEALPEIKGSVFPDLLKRVRQTGKSHFENESHFYFLRDNKEELVYFNFVYQPYYEDENEKAAGVLVVANEVTELVMARKKAEESELRFRNLVAGADVATAVYLGEEMRIQYANEAMIRLWGKDASVVGNTVREALPELEGQPFFQLLQNVYHTGKTYWGKEDKGTLMMDGELKEFYFNFSYKALRNADGEVYGILNMAIDVTNEVLTRQKIEESEANLQLRVAERTLELELKNRELQHMNANLEEFAFAASHDLKEPVRKIHYFSDRLATQLAGRLSEEELRILSRMQHATRRMGTLIDDLLSFSQVNRGITAVEEVNLKVKLEAVLEDLELQIAEKKAEVHYSHLPVINGNKRQWQQLFQNIISNALKYSRQDVAPQIYITAQEIKGSEVPVHLPAEERESSFYKIEIKDNGIGFNQKDADRIFNIFTRLHGNAEYRGTGIGLSIVQKVVENHKGFITAEGMPDKGASFKIYIPKAAVAVAIDKQVEPG